MLLISADVFLVLIAVILMGSHSTAVRLVAGALLIVVGGVLGCAALWLREYSLPLLLSRYIPRGPLHAAIRHYRPSPSFHSPQARRTLGSNDLETTS